jgi:putative peptidoglycan lipid II flippase
MAQFLKNIMTVSGFTVLSRLTGFLRDMLIAAVLGTGPLADAFFVAFRFPNFFRRLFAEGAFQSAFVPLFASIYKSQGEAAARSVAEQIFAILFVAVTIVMIIVEISAPWLLHGIAPGFTQDTQQLAVAIDFVRVTFPYIGFMSFAAMFAGILNSLDRFASAAAAPILLNIFMIAALLGWNICAETPAHALVWAVVFAGAAQALWLAFTCRKIGFGLRLRRPKLSPEVKAFLKRLGPGALSAAVLQFNALIGMIMASTLPLGTVSHLFFADRLVQLPLSLIGVAISTTLLPRLSRDVQEGAWPQIY